MEKLQSEKLEALAKTEARRYKAEWRKRNKDKVRESNKRYWINRALKRIEGESEDGGNG